MVAATSNGVDAAGAADHRRGHGAGGGVRRDRHVHRRPRLRPGAPALPRPPHRDLHAGDGVRRGHEGRAARRAARSARSTSTTDGLRPRLPGQRHRLGVPRRPGPRDRPRGGRQGRQVRVPRAAAGRATRPAPNERRRPSRWLLRQGNDLLRFRSVVTVGRAGQGGAGPGLGLAREAGARRHRAGRAPVSASCRPASPRPSSPRRSATRCYVATDVALPQPGRGRRRRRRRSPSRSPARSPSSRASPGATPRSARAPRSRSTTSGAPFDGKYSVTSSRHVYDQATGYTTHFAVTGRQERSLFGLASGGGSRRARR